MTSSTSASLTSTGEWLTTRRASAVARLADLPAPSTDDEVWRYSPVADLGLDTVPSATSEPAMAEPGATAGADFATVTMVDGIVTGITVASDDGPDVAISSGRSVDVAPFEPEQHDDDFVAVLNRSAARDVLFIDVPRGVVLPGPIVIDHSISAERALVAATIAVRMGPDSEATVVEVRHSDAGDALVVPVVHLDVADAARLRYLDAQFLARTTTQVGQQFARVGAQGSVSIHQAAMGGDYARMRTDCVLAGRGADARLAAASFVTGDQTVDFRTFQDHDARDTTSNLLFAGAGAGHSRSIYTGLIRVAPGAQGIVAHQTNRNIKLSEHAWAESVPNLEIENNDVQCSHASAIGPIDPDQRFYLESRGVPPQIAERLIVTGFFDEVTAEFPHDGVRDRIRAVLDGLLGEAR